MVVDGTGRGDNSEPAEQPSAPQTQGEPVSDADWLRSKTSRLLGLLDEEEQEEFNAGADQKAEASKEAEAEPSPETRSSEEMVVHETEIDVNINLIRSSARLFVRNLPYEAKEAELESLFVPFGKIEEVSPFFFVNCPLAIIHGCSNDDLPDRDIRCKANDVNRIRVF